MDKNSPRVAAALALLQSLGLKDGEGCTVLPNGTIVIIETDQKVDPYAQIPEDVLNEVFLPVIEYNPVVDVEISPSRKVNRQQIGKKYSKLRSKPMQSRKMARHQIPRRR